MGIRKDAAIERSIVELEGIGQVEEVSAQEQQVVPPEEIVRPSGFGVRKMDSPVGTRIILTFVTPFKNYTFDLDEEAAKVLSENVLPSPIVRATPLDLPPGVRR